jgi:hypothetical protein
LTPSAERRAKADAAKSERLKATTFRECAEAYIAAHKGEWENDKQRKQWPPTLETHACLVFGSKPVAHHTIPLEGAIHHISSKGSK